MGLKKIGMKWKKVRKELKQRTEEDVNADGERFKMDEDGVEFGEDEDGEYSAQGVVKESRDGIIGVGNRVEDNEDGFEEDESGYEGKAQK
ncbi:hypothetical protein RUND412_000257 [Rhizina undulata]